MRNLKLFPLLILILIPELAWSYSCKSLDEAAKFLNTKEWMKTSREFRIAKKGEPFIELSSKEAATNYAYRFPAFDKFGFGKPNALEWTKVTGRMESSLLKGKTIGWERKLEDGSWARIRIDYSPEAGAHYNIEMRVPGESNKFEMHKLSVHFNCADHNCTPQEVLKMAEKLSK